MQLICVFIKTSNINKSDHIKCSFKNIFALDFYLQASRDEICGLQDWCDIGFTRVNMRPIKQVLQTYASKWMFTYTKYLSDQVIYMKQYK